jgi:hypothetical protein
MGPPIAREILTRLGASPALTEEVCDIVGHHHHPRPEESTNFQCVYDADLIVNLEEEEKNASRGRDALEQIIEKAFLTETGGRLAQRSLLKGPEGE